MATIDYVTEETGAVWNSLGPTDNGRALKINRRSLVMSAVQLTGPVSFGNTVKLEGSLDGSNWFTLRDTRGNPCEFTAPGYAELSSAATYVRPNSMGGLGGVTVRLALGGP